MTTKKPTVLVADDDPRLLKLIQRNLELANYRVLTVSDGLSVLKQAESEEPDLYVLDIGMPGLDGWEVCRRLREFSIAPVLMLTARETDEDKVKGLGAGADDYLTKPYSAPELVARVKALIRRTKQYTKEASTPVFSTGDLTVDFGQHQALMDGHPINLTPTEYRILAYLARNASRVVTQDDPGLAERAGRYPGRYRLPPTWEHYPRLAVVRRPALHACAPQAAPRRVSNLASAMAQRRHGAYCGSAL